jgi:hypothetical protein
MGKKCDTSGGLEVVVGIGGRETGIVVFAGDGLSFPFRRNIFPKKPSRFEVSLALTVALEVAEFPVIVTEKKGAKGNIEGRAAIMQWGEGSA